MSRGEYRRKSLSLELSQGFLNIKEKLYKQGLTKIKNLSSKTLFKE